MIDKIKSLKLHQWVFLVCFVISLTLIIAGFIIPPTGVVDGSVLTAVGELFAFATLAQLPSLINGHNIELSKGEIHVAINDKDPNDGI